MKTAWDKLVSCLLTTGPLTDRRIEKYSLQGRYGSARQQMAQARLVARVEASRIKKNQAIDKRRRTLAEAARLVQDFL